MTSRFQSVHADHCAIRTLSKRVRQGNIEAKTINNSEVECLEFMIRGYAI